MGTWNVGIKDLVETMAYALDNVEGDFSSKQLKEALQKMEEYPYVSNLGMSEKKWKEYLNDVTQH
ncbi:hypothetical protein LCGC14_2677140 [marine sediment metagenome]|uniref:Uncharacterized protein n=1 Tax=marine sediment metagenome TaxID=412755 RepID=A0A0F9BXA8_9ZZZZ